MKKAMLGALLALATVAAHAGGRGDLETSAVIDGTIVLAKDGTVQVATVTNPEKYGKPIADLVQRVAMTWRFEPVVIHDQPVVAKSSMHVRVILKKTEDGNYSARVKGATFGDDNADVTDNLYRENHDREGLPRYPMDAIRGRVQGTVYVALHVDREGRVAEAVVEQVNLQNLGSEGVLTRYRKLLAEASLKAARTWKYRLPTAGPLAKQDSWTVHEPIAFTLHEMGDTSPDPVWRTYVPGPYTPAPWIDRPNMSAADALADDGMRTEGAGPILITRFDHG